MTIVALQATGVSKTYDGVTVLRDVDLCVEAGSLHALLGPNGAGKTTLLRILLGLVSADAGSVEVLGRPVASGMDGVAGFVESPAFWPYLTVRHTLELLADLEGRPQQTQALLQRVGLARAIRNKVSGLSVGERQRLGIAVALQREPQLLLLDEPSTGLDPAGVRDLHALLRELASDGTAVLLSSHLMAEVDSLCDHATIMARGEVLDSASLAELRAGSPNPQVCLRTSDDTAALALARATGIAVEATSEGLVLRGTTNTLDQLVLSLAAAGIAARALSPIGSPLEDFFLALTGPTEAFTTTATGRHP